jgi:hypothetical protein
VRAISTRRSRLRSRRAKAATNTAAAAGIEASRKSRRYSPAVGALLLAAMRLSV